MSKLQSVMDALETLSGGVLRCVSCLHDTPQRCPANREACCEDADEETVVVHLHVTNETNGQRLRREMAEAVQHAIAEAIPGAEALVDSEEAAAPQRVTVLIPNQEGEQCHY